MKNNQKFIAQNGFTLIELMVSITLGLLITAAAVQVFTSGLISTRVHQANAEIQDSGILGLEFIARDIRMANYGNLNNLKIDDQTLWGGIVLSVGATSNLPIASVGNALLSNSVGDTVGTEDNEWQGLSGVNTAGNVHAASDQLTIQFVAPEDTVNCEGLNVLAGDYVIQRYFLRPVSDDQPDDLALACDANTPAATRANVEARPSAVQGFGGAGQIILPRVDQLRFYLGTWEEVAGSDDKRLAYYSIHEYKDKAISQRGSNLEAPRVVSVRIATLIRSVDSTNNPHVDLTLPIAMLDQNVIPKNQDLRYARQVYTTTAALRNALGEKI